MNGVWTKDRPTKAGLYWMRDPDGYLVSSVPVPCEVIRLDDGLGVVQLTSLKGDKSGFGVRPIDSDELLSCEFIGPLECPVERPRWKSIPSDPEYAQPVVEAVVT